MHIPISRWGEPYKSMDVDQVVHFDSGEVLAEVSRSNGGLVERDMRQMHRARGVLREIPIRELLQMVKKAGTLYTEANLPLGDGTQSPDQFAGRPYALAADHSAASRSRAQARTPGAVDAVSNGQCLHPGGRAEAGDRDLPRPGRYRRRRSQELPEESDLRRHSYGGAVQG